jgi:hypothetical protein
VNVWVYANRLCFLVIQTTFFKEQQMTFRNLGNVGAVPQTRNDFTVTSSDTTDVFAFTTQGDRSINVAVTDVKGPGLTPTSGSGLRLNLYRDNGNGVFDAGDKLLRTSTKVGSNDELIGMRQPTGMYFAEVARNSVETNTVRYDFAVSATQFEPPNLIAGRSRIDEITALAFVSDTRTTDNLRFSISDNGMKIRLTGLTGNANMRVIQDLNANQIIDSGDIVRQSSNAGTSSESITVQGIGFYMLQVYQAAPGVVADGQISFELF